MDLQIIYEDDYLLILDKPAQQLTHPLSHEPETSLANGVMAYFASQGKDIGCHPIYRLDRNTSGLVIFSKVPQIQFWWGNDHDKLQRRYYALVTGRLTGKGEISSPIRRCPDSIVKQEVHPEGKRALTYYEVLAASDDYSLVALQLATGRTHQIRVHMASIGHPLLGDDLYGGSKSLIERQALHAYEAKFQHPFSKEPIIVHSPLPEDMQKLLDKENM